MKKICLNCTEEYSTHKKDQKYCSKQCRDDASRIKYKLIRDSTRENQNPKINDPIRSPNLTIRPNTPQENKMIQEFLKKKRKKK